MTFFQTLGAFLGVLAIDDQYALTGVVVDLAGLVAAGCFFRASICAAFPDCAFFIRFRFAPGRLLGRGFGNWRFRRRCGNLCSGCRGIVCLLRRGFGRRLLGVQVATLVLRLQSAPVRVARQLLLPAKPCL